jgi:hypothetical protein
MHVRRGPSVHCILLSKQPMHGVRLVCFIHWKKCRWWPGNVVVPLHYHSPEMRKDLKWPKLKNSNATLTFVYSHCCVAILCCCCQADRSGNLLSTIIFEHTDFRRFDNILHSLLSMNLLVDVKSFKWLPDNYALKILWIIIQKLVQSQWLKCIRFQISIFQDL